MTILALILMKTANMAMVKFCSFW
uniref:Uncharacterized protein n=1 Tax=Arundo donax TaxID=35708 RepID=A0A0A9HYV5_ARUDO